MISVMIADDHHIVVEGLARIINESDGIRVVATAPTLSETLELVAKQKPDVLLLDVSLPDGDGIDAIPQLQAELPETAVIILTMFAEAAVIRRAMQNGAKGYLFKSTNADELLTAIRKVDGGETYLCAEAQQALAGNKEKDIALTMREREILRLIVEGFTMKEIADRLCLSFETVHSYTKNLRLKLGCNNTASLVNAALKRHLV